MSPKALFVKVERQAPPSMDDDFSFFKSDSQAAPAEPAAAAPAVAAADEVPAAAAASSMPPPKPRKKVPFEKGYSQMDWLKLTRTHPDLAGLKGASRRLISMDEVKLHKRADDAWTVLRGRVYNITAYMNFHPGGLDMLMKAAGRDCTLLFNKYHAWVNAEFLLEKCLVGVLEET